MDAIIILCIAVVLGFIKSRNVEVENVSGVESVGQVLEVGTNLFLECEPNAFELILEELNLK